jgi:hypothetical protein
MGHLYIQIFHKELAKLQECLEQKVVCNLDIT